MAVTLAGCADDAELYEQTTTTTTESTPTPTPAPVAPAIAGEVIFSEFMPNPNDLADTAGEWFELYNTTTETFDLHGCGITDLGTDAHFIYKTLNIDPGQFITLAISTSAGFTAT